MPSFPPRLPPPTLFTQGLSAFDRVVLVPARGNECPTAGAGLESVNGTYIRTTFQSFKSTLPTKAVFTVTPGTTGSGIYKLCIDFAGPTDGTDYSSAVGSADIYVGETVVSLSPTNVIQGASQVITILGSGFSGATDVLYLTPVSTSTCAAPSDNGGAGYGAFTYDAGASIPPLKVVSSIDTRATPGGRYRLCVRFGGAGAPTEISELGVGFAALTFAPNAVLPGQAITLSVEGVNMASTDVLRFVPSTDALGCATGEGGHNICSAAAGAYLYAGNFSAVLQLAASNLPGRQTWLLTATSILEATTWRLCLCFGGAGTGDVRRVGGATSLLHAGRKALSFSPTAVATGVSRVILTVSGIGLTLGGHVRLTHSSQTCTPTTTNYAPSIVIALMANASTGLIPSGARYNVTLGNLPGGTYRLCASYADAPEDFSSQIGSATFGVGSSVSAFSPVDIFGVATAEVVIAGYGLTHDDIVTVVTTEAACHDSIHPNITGTYDAASSSLPERSAWTVAVGGVPAGSYFVCIRLGGVSGTATIQVGTNILQLGSIAKSFSPASILFGDYAQTLTVTGIGLSLKDVAILIPSTDNCATATAMLLDATMTHVEAGSLFPLSSVFQVTPRSVEAGAYKICVAFEATASTFVQVGASLLQIGPVVSSFAPVDIAGGATTTSIILTGLALAADVTVHLLPGSAACEADTATYKDPSLGVRTEQSGLPTALTLAVTPNSLEGGRYRLCISSGAVEDYSSSVGGMGAVGLLGIGTSATSFAPSAIIGGTGSQTLTVSGTGFTANVVLILSTVACESASAMVGDATAVFQVAKCTGSAGAADAACDAVAQDGPEATCVGTTDSTTGDPCAWTLGSSLPRQAAFAVTTNTIAKGGLYRVCVKFEGTFYFVPVENTVLPGATAL